MQGFFGRRSHCDPFFFGGTASTGTASSAAIGRTENKVADFG
jgi:hypothetical protein